MYGTKVVIIKVFVCTQDRTMCSILLLQLYFHIHEWLKTINYASRN